MVNSGGGRGSDSQRGGNDLSILFHECVPQLASLEICEGNDELLLLELELDVPQALANTANKTAIIQCFTMVRTSVPGLGPVLGFVIRFVRSRELIGLLRWKLEDKDFKTPSPRPKGGPDGLIGA